MTNAKAQMPNEIFTLLDKRLILLLEPSISLYSRKLIILIILLYPTGQELLNVKRTFEETFDIRVLTFI
jgi:hypothetical protein